MVYRTGAAGGEPGPRRCNLSWSELRPGWTGLCLCRHCRRYVHLITLIHCRSPLSAADGPNWAVSTFLPAAIDTRLPITIPSV